MADPDLEELRQLAAEFRSASDGLLGALARLEATPREQRPSAEDLEPVRCCLRDAAAALRRVSACAAPRLAQHLDGEQEEAAMRSGLRRLALRVLGDDNPPLAGEEIPGPPTLPFKAPPRA